MRRLLSFPRRIVTGCADCHESTLLHSLQKIEGVVRAASRRLVGPMGKEKSARGPFSTAKDAGAREGGSVGC